MIAPRHDTASFTPHPIVASWCTWSEDRPVIIDVGPGRGDFLFHLSQRHPACHIIGIEMRRQRFCKLVARRSEHDNISLFWGDARIVLPQVASRARVQAIYLNFPDPWPKRRHAKHRLLQPAFLRQCVDALMPNGELWCTTDDAHYATTTAAHLTTTPTLVVCFPQPIVTTNPAAYPTYFAQKWAREGRTIYYQRYRKI